MRAAVAVLALVCVLLAGCGGGGGGTDVADGGGDETTPSEGTLESLWRAPGEDVAVVAGTSDYGPGQNRISFLVVDSQSRLITSPTAKVWVARGLDQKPFQETTARLERIGVPGGSEADASHIYVAHVDLPEPGKYWYVAEPEGTEQTIQALGNLVVPKQSIAPAIGDPAPASKTPTLASTGGDLQTLSTAKKPDRELYRSSVAEALKAQVPFVVSFATPLFCQTRACAPVVEVVSAVRKKFTDSDVRFINVEIYEDNDPAKGTNQWVDEWELPTEPFTFVVGRDGKVAAKIEGAFSAAELSAAVTAAQ